VRRKQSKKQEIDYTQNDAFSTPVLEEQLDKTVMMIQEVKEQVGRCIQMPAITEEADVPDYAELIDAATVAAQDAADDASDSADAAAASAAAAAVSAGAATTNGAAQVALAEAQVALATTQAGNAATSADEAAASALEAVEIVGGTIKASQAEAEAATDDLKYMTPLQVKNEVQKSGAVLIPAANVVLTGKEDALGYTPENVANKDTDGTLAANSDTKYPSQKAVKTAISNSIPSGIITMWSGTIATIPSGWLLCNGSNGTPDLRDRFIVGAKQDDSGVAKTNVTGSLTQSGNGTIPSHQHGATGLSTSDPGNHTHSIINADSGDAGPYGGSGNAVGSTGAAGAHTHTISGSVDAFGTGSTNIAVYYALAFIMKS
jgi:hypothetical protein